MAEPDFPAQVAADIAAGKVTLAFASHDAVRSFFDEAVKHLGFMVTLAERPRPFVTMAFTSNGPGGLEVGFKARVVQIFERSEGFLVAFVLIDWDQAKTTELARKLAGAAARATDESEHAGASPAFRIRELDGSARARLAMKADRSERQILCRDASPQVLLALLSNPRLEAEEVLAVVKSTHAVAGVLERVATERRWMSSAEIRTAVVRNPKTPTPLALRLLDTLPITELREMAKMGSLREDVRRAAFRVYERMASRR